ncbi:phosphatase [Dacryopinax primogenitus]|uniref:Phosphatase n=1 Tax=Dacryopinax primogenitus (strain DJM 731) TaxID=1858805 RepID=M5GCB1_DACPD|nr:phosphatase [Dacryopinax primogenitus]EJU06135.1 phosphatase [Dacryopinax primogenitus]
MDGTLVESTPAVVGAWEEFHKSYPHLDLTEVLQHSHGIRTIENLRNFCKITHEEHLAVEVVRFEAEIVRQGERLKAEGKGGIKKLPGVEALVGQVENGAENQKWAIATSATRIYASAALSIADIQPPEAFVTAEDVAVGKPFPDPYLLAARLVGKAPHRCLVVEDAPNGIRSGKSAGAKVIGLLTSHSRKEVEDAKPDWIVPDLSWVTARHTTTGLEFTIKEYSP